MHVGVCTINLRILESRSLSAVIGVVSVSGDQHHLNKVLSHVVTFVEKMHLVELVDYKIELAY
jgi:uncharacterized protein YlxP (DUF503 family)